MRFLGFLCALLLAFPPAARGEGADVTRWRASKPHTSITFTARQMGTEFTGSFGRYEVEIAFDPARLADSRVVARIDVASLATGDLDRDTAAMAGDWFDAAAFPQARFESTALRHLGGDRYEAEGNLVIKDISVPVTLPVTLEIIKKKDAARRQARMTAEVVLDRSRWNLGTGQWADESVIANEVSVRIEMQATELLAGEEMP